LLDAGAAIDHKNNVGNSALMLAVLADSTATARVLLDAGADVSGRNAKREQADAMAHTRNNPEMIELFTQHEKQKRFMGLF
jgi:ankyrin repeat protein